MILDVPKFIEEELPHWEALERYLDRLERDWKQRLSLEEIQRVFYLYERAAADLAKLATVSAETERRQYLERLVARAYGEIHAETESSRRFSLFKWLSVTLPNAFRRHRRAFYLTVAVTLAGVLFGAAVTVIDPASRYYTMPFGHGELDPVRRVAIEESTGGGKELPHALFSAFLMTHNTRVALLTLALGATWGVGTFLVLFQNGVGLGAIGIDYILAGKTEFLLGWLLPHGVVEIPAILIAAQAGLVLAHAIIGRGDPRRLRTRVRAVAADVVTLAFVAALLLVWAGLIEAFFSQMHEPALPYEVKIAFGLVELGLLILYLSRCGRATRKAAAQDHFPR